MISLLPVGDRRLIHYSKPPSVLLLDSAVPTVLGLTQPDKAAVPRSFARSRG
jgi:hypothetical protein